MTINGETLIDDKGNFNERLWLESCIAIADLLSEKEDGEEEHEE